MEALKMEAPMTEWNDDRLDELNGRMKEGFANVEQQFAKVDQQFAKVDQQFAKVERDMKDGFAEVKAEIRRLADHTDGRIERVEDRLDKVMYTLMATGLGLIVTALTALLN